MPKNKAAGVLCVIWLCLMAWGFVDEFCTNKPIEFYSSHPEQLLHLVGIVAVGSMVALAFYWTAPRHETRPKQFSLWAMLLLITAVAFVLAFVQILRGMMTS